MSDVSGTAPETTSLRPSVEDVAALLRARTKDAEGREVGTFNDETRPTADQVETHIDAAMGLVALRLPDTVPLNLSQGVVSLVAYRAALRIEKSYFPEQVRSDRSPYEELRQEYVDDLQALMDALASAGDEGGFGVAGHRAHSEWTPTFLRIFGEGYYDGAPYPVPYDHWPEPENPANWASPFQPPREPPLPEDLPVGEQPASGTEWPG